MIKQRFLLYLFSFCAATVIAQKSAYISYGLEDGLPQSQVRAITQDSSGYLWIGTMAGLSRFDGVEFKNFSKKDGLNNNQINCFYRGSKLYVGSTGALCYVEGQKISGILFPQELETARVLDFAESKNGDLYMATAGSGVIKWDGKDFTSISTADGLPDNYVRSLAFDQTDRLWIGTRSGIVLLNPSETSLTSSDSTLSKLSVSQIEMAADGKMVVTTFGNGIFFVEGESIRNFTTKNGLSTNFIRSFEELPSGQYWFASKVGLAKFEDEGFDTYDETNGLSYANIKSLGQDREGNLWIGTDGQGLLRRTGEVFRSFSVQNGLNSDLVMSIAQGSNDSLLLGTYDAGISILKNDTAISYPFNSRLPSFTVWCLSNGANGLLAGTSSGLFVEKNGITKTINEESGLPGNRITSIYLKSAEEILLGTENGLVFLDSDFKVKTVLSQAEKKNFGGVRAITQYNGEIVCGTEIGLVKLDEENATVVPGNVPSEASVYCLSEDDYGTLWVGTSDGLFALSAEDDSLREAKFANGFGAKNINFLTALGLRRMLIGTNNGMYSIDLDKYHENSVIETKHYTRFEGLSGSETNQNAVFSKDESIWFGTTQGVVRFDMGQEPQQATAPSVEISNIQLFLEDVDWRNIADSFSVELGLPIDPELKYSQNYLTFNYNGIYFTNPEKIRYRYKVDGVDNNWLGPTKSRSATYAYLPHGDFTFRVQSFQVDNPQLVAEATFPFSVKPPFYLTPWFFLLVAISLAGTVYVIYSSRLNKEREKRERLQLELQTKLMQLESQSLNSSMNRHFIFNALNSIQYYINMQDRKSANRYLTSFAKLIRKNLDSSQQMDTSLGEELERLKLYLSLEQMRFQEKFDYEIEIDPNIDVDALTLPAMMLQPFLENSIWHGILPNEAVGKIYIRIVLGEGNYEIIIDDNGVGIETSLKNKTNGLEAHVSQGMDITLNRVRLYQNMTGLKYEVDGPFELKTQAGNTKGTRVIIRIPKKSTVPELNGSQTWKIEADELL
ncbi:MAG TPA: two-component regulator propeller domain-containing protein [Cryomorphaceae bacterium]|nr:two-component regulator propeller domain-containing protein [Cryomorphaceae bacterium]